MAPTVAATVASSSVSAAERTAAKLEAIVGKMPTPNSSTKAERVESKYDVVLDFPNLELHSAAASGNLGLVHYALTHGQPVNSLLHGCLPLHAACSGGSVSVVRMLIERGADVNAPRLPRRYSDNGKRNSGSVAAVGTVGSTPLHFAAANGHAPVVQILLACGAVADKPDKNGMTPADLAEMSGYTEVVRAIRVWSHLSDRPDTSFSEPDNGVNRRSRASSNASSTWTASEGEVPPSRKGKERATSMVSAASEKARLFRSSFENGFRNGKPAATQSNGNGPGDAPVNGVSPTVGPESDRTTPTGRPELSIVPIDTIDSDNPSSELPSPFPLSPTSPSPVDDDGDGGGQLKSPTADLESPGPSPYTPSHRSSRRPSLPSIFEKAAHPGAAFRHAMRKTEKDTSPSITESDRSPPPPAGFFSRGRARTTETIHRTKSQKQAILGLFRRGHSPPSRSPSPPRKVEPASRPVAAEQLEEGIARLKRASMDPEMMQMAMEAVQLGDQLEAAASISAPVTKTHFFDERPCSPSAVSDRQTAKLPPMPSVDVRNLERRSRNGTHSNVVSPSPLANAWGDDSDEEPRKAIVRRSVTEVRKHKGKDAPRRMPSMPAMPGGLKRRSQLLASNPSVNDTSTSASCSADVSAEPSSDNLSMDSFTSVNGVTPERSSSLTSASTPAVDATPTASDASRSTTAVPDTTPTVNGDGHVAPPATVPAATDAPGTTTPPMPETDEDTRRFRGESIGSQLTDSVTTPPSSRVLTPPGTGAATRPDASDVDLRSLGIQAASPPSPESRPTTHPGASKATAMSSLGPGAPPARHPTTRHSSTTSAGASARASRPASQRSVSEVSAQANRPQRPQRTFSTHAEARDAMEQDERDVLSLAQLPASELSSRSLADQLAAYGESHAQAQEFARVERLSTRSTNSDRRLNRHSELSSGSGTSYSGDSSRVPPSRNSSKPALAAPDFTAIDPSINRIYDQREAAYRQRMQSLVSAPPMHGMQKRQASRSRATSASDMWLTAGPTASAAHPRRLTDPPRNPSTDDVDTHPHISNPMPMVSDLSRARKNSSPRMPTVSSIKAATSSLPRGSPHGSVLSNAARRSGSGSGANGSGGLAGAASLSGGSASGLGASVSRSSSLSKPNSHVLSTRYQGLAQARAYAQSSIMASRQPMYRAHDSDGSADDDDGESEPPEPVSSVLETEWRVDPAPAPSVFGKPHHHKKWGQIKGAIGHLKRH